MQYSGSASTSGFKNEGTPKGQLPVDIWRQIDSTQHSQSIIHHDVPGPKSFKGCAGLSPVNWNTEKINLSPFTC